MGSFHTAVGKKVDLDVIHAQINQMPDGCPGHFFPFRVGDIQGLGTIDGRQQRARIVPQEKILHLDVGTLRRNITKCCEPVTGDGIPACFLSFFVQFLYNLSDFLLIQPQRTIQVDECFPLFPAEVRQGSTDKFPCLFPMSQLQPWPHSRIAVPSERD